VGGAPAGDEELATLVAAAMGEQLAGVLGAHQV
jgi:hypothetical protein